MRLLQLAWQASGLLRVCKCVNFESVQRQASLYGQLLEISWVKKARLSTADIYHVVAHYLGCWQPRCSGRASYIRVVPSEICRHLCSPLGSLLGSGCVVRGHTALGTWPTLSWP